MISQKYMRIQIFPNLTYKINQYLIENQLFLKFYKSKFSHSHSNKNFPGRLEASGVGSGYGPVGSGERFHGRVGLYIFFCCIPTLLFQTLGLWSLFQPPPPPQKKNPNYTLEETINVYQK